LTSNKFSIMNLFSTSDEEGVRSTFDGLIINPVEQSKVIGCANRFRHLGLNLADEGRIEYLSTESGTIATQVVVGDLRKYDNMIDVSFPQNDFGNMLLLMDMLERPELNSEERFTEVFQTSMDWVMPPPEVVKRNTDLELSASDMEYAMIAEKILTRDTPLYNPNLGTVNRMISQCGGMGPIYVCKNTPEKMK